MKTKPVGVKTKPVETVVLGQPRMTVAQRPPNFVEIGADVVTVHFDLPVEFSALWLDTPEGLAALRNVLPAHVAVRMDELIVECAASRNGAA